jgi:hypothetical protein
MRSIFSANSFAGTTALARSIEGACGMSPYLSALETSQSKLRTSIWSLCSQSRDRRRNTTQLLWSQSGNSGTQQNFCAANQERENQTIAPRSPTFRRVSFKSRPRLYRGDSASKLFDLISLFNAATWLPSRDSQNEYTPRTCQLYESRTVVNRKDGKAMSTNHALETLC